MTTRRNVQGPAATMRIRAWKQRLLYELEFIGAYLKIEPGALSRLFERSRLTGIDPL
jgi:hypothetical protein